MRNLALITGASTGIGYATILLPCDSKRIFLAQNVILIVDQLSCLTLNLSDAAQ